MNFPNSPSDGDTFNGFIYDSTLGVWDVLSPPAVKKFAVTNSGSGAYVFDGDGTDTDSNPTLYLTRGETYQFVVNASGHPFYIKTVSGTGTGNAYADGVSGNGAETGTISFEVPMDAPSKLYYNCSAHSSMAGEIIIPRAAQIDDLSDVDTSTAAPTDGQVLTWDNANSKWEPATVASGSSYGDSDVDTHLNQSSASTNEVLSWNGSDYDWVAQSGGGGGASVTTADAAPSSPSDGDLWYDTTTLRLYVYYNDGSSSQWVKANPSGSGGSYSDSDVDTHLNSGTAASNEILSWNGSDYEWIEQSVATVYALSGTAIDPTNGGIQTKTVAANTTFTETLASGESVVLMLEGGASYTITWPTITWVTNSGNSAPTLTAKDTLVLWKVSTTLYGAYVGGYA